MFRSPELLHALLAHLAEQLITYASYQIQCGAQVLSCQASVSCILSILQLQCCMPSLLDQSYSINFLELKLPETR